MSVFYSPADPDMALQCLYVILLVACLLVCLQVMFQALSYLMQVTGTVIHLVAALKQVMAALQQVILGIIRCLKYLSIVVLCAIFLFWFGHWHKVAPPPESPVSWHAHALEALAAMRKPW